MRRPNRKNETERVSNIHNLQKFHRFINAWSKIKVSNYAHKLVDKFILENVSKGVEEISICQAYQRGWIDIHPLCYSTGPVICLPKVADWLPPSSFCLVLLSHFYISTSKQRFILIATQDKYCQMPNEIFGSN